MGGPRNGSKHGTIPGCNRSVLFVLPYSYWCLTIDLKFIFFAEGGREGWGGGEWSERQRAKQ